MATLACVSAGAPVAAADTNPWVGAAHDANWSDGANWASGMAFTGPMQDAQMTFPVLSTPACMAVPPTATCYSVNNDDSSGPDIVNLSIDDGQNYSITGDMFYLGNSLGFGPRGGLTVAPAGIPSSVAYTSITAPITLLSDQTWSIDGGPNNADLNFAVAAVSGNHTLTLSLTRNPYVDITGHVDVGTVSVTGSGGVVLNTGDRLNDNGNAVGLAAGTSLAAVGSSQVGALSSAGARVQVGIGIAPDAILSSTAGVSLDASTELDLYIDAAGTTPGADHSQLAVTGNVSLGGASLNLSQGSAAGVCHDLHPGDVLTLISATGTVSGTFSGLPDGSTLDIYNGCDNANAAATATIHYTSNAVTATIDSGGDAGDAPQLTSAPTIAGTAQQGQTLTASPGSWLGNPAPSFSYQWSNCGSTGLQCSAIANATGSTYVPSAGDVGDELELTVTASNASGVGTASSTTTAPVQIAPPVNLSAPAITGTAAQGDMLTASTGSWAPTPTAFTYRWQECDSAGAGCVAIPGASAATYTVTAADVSHTIVVQVIASDAGGAGLPASSAPTAVVTGPATTQQPPATTPTRQPPSTSQIRAALAALLAPLGSRATIAALIRHHRYRLTFDAPAAGTLTVTWSAIVHHRSRAIAMAGVAATGAGATPVELVLERGTGGQLRRRGGVLLAVARFTTPGAAPVNLTRAFKPAR